MKKPKASDFVFLDTETVAEKETYFEDKVFDDLIEIGIVDIEGNVLLQSLVKPLPKYHSTEWNGTKYHGLTIADLQDAPTLMDISEQVSEIISNRYVVAHNSQFDLSVLRQSWKANGLKMEDFPSSRWIDTKSEYEKAFLSHIENPKELRSASSLKTLCTRYGFYAKDLHHRASHDAEMLRKLFMEMYTLDMPYPWEWTQSVTKHNRVITVNP